jgi:hypothetical protein
MHRCGVAVIAEGDDGLALGGGEAHSVLPVGG